MTISFSSIHSQPINDTVLEGIFWRVHFGGHFAVMLHCQPMLHLAIAVKRQRLGVGQFPLERCQNFPAELPC